MKRRKKPVPLMLFWSKREQARFIQAVERFQGIVGDLETALTALKLIVQLKSRPRPSTRQPVLTAADQPTAQASAST